MSNFPFDSICEICKQRLLASDDQKVIAVQKIFDENGNRVENAPIFYYHQDCLNVEGTLH
jgi:hypothetical protein